MNSYKIIDIENWARKQHCQLFRKSALPQYCVTFEVDITGFYRAVKENGWSFTLAMIHVVTQSASSIENYRYRFLNGEVVLYDKIDTSFAWLNKETELFKYVCVPYIEDINEYIKQAGKAAEEQKEYFVTPPPNDSFIFSPIPWVTFTDKTHTYSGNPENAVPTFDWGKFFEKENKIEMPFSVQVHHSFVDGLHIGKLSESLKRHLDQY